LGNRRSPGIRGSYLPGEAVAALLRNTGLRYEFSGARTVIVSETPSGAPDDPATRH